MEVDAGLLFFITAGAAFAQGFSGFGWIVLAGILNVVKGLAG